MASGVAHRLHRGGMRVCLTEVARPLAVCRGVAFSEAVFDGTKEIMGVTAELAEATSEAIGAVWRRGNIPVVVDPAAAIKERLRPDVLIDALMAKKNTGTQIGDAPLVIGLGPGFQAGQDVHLVVETSHEYNLGGIITSGRAEANTGNPVMVGGLARERVVWADRPGVFTTDNNIGDTVTAGQVVGQLDGRPVAAPLGGMLRGLLRDGVTVVKGAKLIEVDQVNDPQICGFIADKIRVIADGVLTAIKLKYDA